jgi:hypothetical protein
MAGVDLSSCPRPTPLWPSEDWSGATGSCSSPCGSGRTVTGLDIARVAVDAGVGHLRAAGNVLATVRGGPDSR